jgi:hypothetical protein
MSNNMPPPPPPPPSSSTTLGSVKTYIMIAWIFSILAIVAWVGIGLWQIYVYATWTSILGVYGYATVAPIGTLIGGIVSLVFMVLAILIFLRVWKMQKAVNTNDIATLKATSNIMWAIIALIFGLGIVGIMLLIADGPIKQL